MKAITLHQPWAQLVALGVKTIETRSWSTSYRGQLVIHAGAQRVHSGKFIFLSRRLLIDERIDQPTEQRIRRMEVPFGAIVASCTLIDVVPVVALLPKRDRPPGQPSHPAHKHPQLERHVVYGGEMYLCDGRSGKDMTDQLPYGDFTPGRFAWLLEDIKPVEERCPACWTSKLGRPRTPRTRGCSYCGDIGMSDPISAKGKQRIWEWTL